MVNEMANVTLKINHSEISQDRIDQLNKIVTFNNKEQSVFELVCANRFLFFTSITYWSLDDGYYQIKFETQGDYILDKIKRWSASYDFLHDCRIHMFITSSLKHGYYQLFNGSSEVGYSVLKDRPDLIYRLKQDVSDAKSNTAFSKKVIVTSKEWSNVESVQSIPEEKLREYSFFSIRKDWDENELSGSLFNFDPITNKISNNSLFV